MCMYAYRIKMKTPLGEKHGTMLMNINEGTVHGHINIFGNKGSFMGEIHKDGTCRLCGRIITLIRTIEYVADGKAQEETIILTLKGERNTFYISGLACPAGDVL